jgi:hypothetical protein
MPVCKGCGEETDVGKLGLCEVCEEMQECMEEEFQVGDEDDGEID